MTLTIVIAGSIFIIATIHHIIEETKKCENQKKMLAIQRKICYAYKAVT